MRCVWLLGLLPDWGACFDMHRYSERFVPTM